MSAGLLLDRRLSTRTLRDGRLVVDEAACTVATFTTLLNPDGDGKNYRLATWTATGVIAVIAPGKAEALLVGVGGWANSDREGNGASILRGMFDFPAGQHSVFVPNPSDGGTDAMPSRIGTFLASNYIPYASASTTGIGAGHGYAGAGRASGYTSSITGAPVVYAPAADLSKYGGGAPAGAAAYGAKGIVHVRWQI